MIIIGNQESLCLNYDKLKLINDIELTEIIENEIETLNIDYGEDRDIYNDNGGLVAIIENYEDMTAASLQTINITEKLEDYNYEIDDKISDSYHLIQILTDDEYTVSLIIKNDIYDSYFVKKKRRCN